MCQIVYINEIGYTDVFLITEQLINTILKKLGIPAFITRNKKNKNKEQTYMNQRLKDATNLTPYTLNPGDAVKVRSKEQIQLTLDENNKLEGCFFMDEMWQYCGSKQKVLKRVDYFLKEAEFKMLKAHNIVLLDGVHCSGLLSNFKHRCDRACYFFWKEQWLEKIE